MSNVAFPPSAGTAQTLIRPGVLNGVKVVELSLQGPVPFCGMLFSDMGAEVIKIDRADAVGSEPAGGRANEFVHHRGRPSVAVDIKTPQGVETALRLIEQADLFMEGMRPGVAERLGLGPDVCLARNPRLLYGRMTGWGQTGPWAQMAGHDINYIALTGLLHAIGPAGGPPCPPLSLVGDFGGGSMFLAFGLIAGLLEARVSGKGQVIDVSMVDGAALLGAYVYGQVATDNWREERGSNRLDGGAPFYSVYETADCKWVAVGAVERRFYAVFIEALGVEGVDLDEQDNPMTWDATRAKIAAVIRGKSRDEWAAIMEPLEACFTPVLTMAEAMAHKQNRSRGLFVPNDGVLQVAPAPRFSRTPGAIRGPAAKAGENSREALAAWGFKTAELDELIASGAIIQRQSPPSPADVKVRGSE